MPVECLTIHEAEDLLRHCLEQGRVIPGKHFRDELANEGISITDAYAVLRSGNIYDPPEQNMKTGEWKYRIEGFGPEGKWLAIIFSFKTMDTVFLITVFSIKARSKR